MVVLIFQPDLYGDDNIMHCLDLEKFALSVKDDNFIEKHLKDITHCPICDSKMYPELISKNSYKSGKYEHACNEISEIVCICLCRSCSEPFMATFYCNEFGYGTLIKLVPNNCRRVSFDKNINELSPRFVEIYNQAYIAEQNGLLEVCGLAYRKALEFLIKDFAISLNSDKDGEIKAMPLSKCINQYINYDNDISPKLKTVSIAATWLGNDETHYVRKHEDKDLRDLKMFIDTAVSYIMYSIQTNLADKFINNK